MSTLVKIVTTVTLSCFVTGYNIGVSNLSLANVAYDTSTLDETTFSAIHGALFPIGGTIGSLIAGKLANSYGRRNGMRILCLMIFFSCGLVRVK
jgi:MFS family permease